MHINVMKFNYNRIYLYDIVMAEAAAFLKNWSMFNYGKSKCDQLRNMIDFKNKRFFVRILCFVKYKADS